MKKILLSLSFVCVVIGVIFFSSSQPYSKQSLIPFLHEHLPHAWIEQHFSFLSYTYIGTTISIESLGVASFVEFHVRKGAHLFVFACLAMALYVLARRFVQSTARCVVLSFFCSTLYAAFDEFHQSLTPERTPAWQDVLLDATGALIGLLVLLSTRKFLHDMKTRA